MSCCSRTVSSQCRVTGPAIQTVIKPQCIRFFHVSVINNASRMSEIKNQKTRLNARLRAQEREAAEKLKQEMKEKGLLHPPGTQQQKPQSTGPTVPKTLFNNPEAKFVPSLKLETRHLLYSERHVGEVFTFPDNIVKKLEALGLFNEKQGFQYMRQPICLIRHNTGLVARELFAQKEGLGTQDRRVIVAGKGGTGKSFILLQMATMALMQDYIVIAVPRGMDLVDNKTAYRLDEKTMRYKQTEYLANMLTRTRKACASLLHEEVTSRRLRVGREVFPEGTSLYQLLESAEVHPGISQEIFELFLLEMTQPRRPPILFLFDNISAISVPSQIRSPEYPHPSVHPHRLWIPFFFTCLLNGTLKHPNAAVVAATSQFPAARTLDIALGFAEPRSYEPIDRRIPHSIEGATVIRAGDQLTTEEAMGLSSYYMNSGILKTIDRFDGLSKTVGDADYIYPESAFFTYYKEGEEQPEIQRDPFAFKRRGKMNVGIMKRYVKRGGITPKDDPKDFEATAQRIALGGGTIRGFWKACTRMSHF